MERQGNGMQVAAATAVGSGDTARDLASAIRAELGEKRVDAAVLFSSAHFDHELGRIALEIHDLLAPTTFVGMNGETVIHADTEYESRPALALWAVHAPGVRIRSFHLSMSDLPQLDEPVALREHLHIRAEDEPTFLLLADPFSINVAQVLAVLEGAFPGRPALGGLASAGRRPGENRLVFDGQVLRAGLSGLALSGDVRLDPIVSQGCRPIGRHAVITHAESNIIRQIGGRRPIDVVHHLLEQCSEQERELVHAGGLRVGRVINEQQREFVRGDFLIRNAIGFDRDSGALAINDHVRAGQTIQFHVSDAASASADLEALLDSAAAPHAAGALLFTCNGRGTHLFEQASHDARAIRARFPAVPLAGITCAGEIGSIGTQNFIHGHTACIGLFSPAGRREQG